MTRVGIFFILAGLCSSPAAAQSWSDVMKAASPSVLRVVTTDGEKIGLCSGVVVNPVGYVLTAAHCIDGYSEERSITVDGRHADVVRRNALLDLAILKTKLRGGRTAMPLADEMPDAGTDVAVVGHAFGSKQLAIQRGIVANPREEATGRSWINAEFIAGDSGGALVSQDGQLLGLVAAFRYVLAVSLGESVPVDVVRDFAEDYLPAPAKP